MIKFHTHYQMTEHLYELNYMLFLQNIIFFLDIYPFFLKNLINYCKITSSMLVKNKLSSKYFFSFVNLTSKLKC